MQILRVMVAVSKTYSIYTRICFGSILFITVYLPTHPSKNPTICVLQWTAPACRSNRTG
jgi:hypothetical protein